MESPFIILDESDQKKRKKISIFGNIDSLRWSSFMFPLTMVLSSPRLLLLSFQFVSSVSVVMENTSSAFIQPLLDRRPAEY